MGIYLLKSTAILAIFWTLYVLFLEKENMHHFKRFYLLASIIVAFCIPFLTFTEYVYVTPVDGFEFQNEVIPLVIDDALASFETPFWTLNRILLAIYLIGITIFSIRFIRNIFRMVKTITANEKQKQSRVTFVLLKQLINPHTFFSFIFLNKSKFQKREVPEEVILHEETHAKQKHSLDIIFVELLQIIFWFQPFIWLYKKRIKLNHEFLADQAVLDNGFRPSHYQNTLLSYSSHKEYSLSNAINYSSIKKRFTVMKTQTSQKKKWLFSLLILPILGILFYSFSEREIVEVDNPVEDELAAHLSIQNAINNKASEALMSEYKDFIKKYNETKIIYADAYERSVIIYNQLMSDAQRASVEKYPLRILPNTDLSKVKPRKLTSSLFKNFKDSKKYAIWINGQHVSNSELNNYTVNDFVHYTGSRVFKNARSERFPQPNQYHLYTKAGFKATYENSQLKKYNVASKTYTDAISGYLKGPQTDNSELIILKAKADAIYDTFSLEDIKNNNLKTLPPLPAKYPTPRNLNQQKLPSPKEIAAYNAWAKKMKAKFKTMLDSDKVNGVPHMINDEVFRKHNTIYDRMTEKQKANAESLPKAVLVTEWPMPTAVLISKIDNQQKPPTAKEVAAYNTWAKNINAQLKKARADKTSDYPIVKQKDILKYKSIYNRMTKKQLSNAEAFPNLPPPPPPPPAQVKAYKNGKKKTLSEIIKQTPKNTTSGYEVLDNGESHYFIIYGGKKTYYNKDGYITDDKGNVLPPPPAPPIPKKNNGKGGPNREKYTLQELEVPEKSVNNIPTPKSKDYAVRNLILEASKYQTKPLKYLLNGKSTNNQELKTYIKSNPQSDVNFEIGSENILSFSNKKSDKMSYESLEKVYSKVFKNYNTKQALIKYKKIENPKTSSCLEFPKSFMTNKGNTLKIKCIENYSENKFEIYNRWGELIFSRKNYNNDWDGSVEKPFASNGTNKPAPGKYFYVFKYSKTSEQAGYLNINVREINPVQVIKDKSKGGPNADSYVSYD